MKKPSRAAAPEQKPTFEEEIKNLQEAIARLESSDLTLEEALQQFETGCASLRACYRILCDARARVEVLEKSFPDEPPVWEPFVGGEPEGDRNSQRQQE